MVKLGCCVDLKFLPTVGLGDVAVFEKRPARNRCRIELLMMKITTKAQ